MIYQNCPYCSIILEIRTPRYHGYCKCPCCSELIYVGFDEIQNGDEEWEDFQWVEKFNSEDHDLEGTFQLDLFECEKYIIN